MSDANDHDSPRPAPAQLAVVEQVVDLVSGRRIEVSPVEGGRDLVRIRAKDGACVLTVQLTDQGPVLRFEGAALELAATRSLDIACGTLRIEASEGATIAGCKVDIEARAGSVNVRANDDVRIDGERVLLNSADPPMPVSWEEFNERQKAREKEPHLGDGSAATEDLPSGQRDS